METVASYADDRVSISPSPADKLVNIRLPAGAELPELPDVFGKRVNARFSGREGCLRRACLVAVDVVAEAVDDG